MFFNVLRCFCAVEDFNGGWFIYKCSSLVFDRLSGFLFILTLVFFTYKITWTTFNKSMAVMNTKIWLKKVWDLRSEMPFFIHLNIYLIKVYSCMALNLNSSNCYASMIQDVVFIWILSISYEAYPLTNGQASKNFTNQKYTS